MFQKFLIYQIENIYSLLNIQRHLFQIKNFERKNLKWLSQDQKQFFFSGENFVSLQALTGSIQTFFSKILFGLFSAIQDLSFDVLKCIFIELFFGSYKGISKKFEIYQKLTFPTDYFFLSQTTTVGKYCVQKKRGGKKTSTIQCVI